MEYICLWLCHWDVDGTRQSISHCSSCVTKWGRCRYILYPACGRFACVWDWIVMMWLWDCVYVGVNANSRKKNSLVDSYHLSCIPSNLDSKIASIVPLSSSLFLTPALFLQDYYGIKAGLKRALWSWTLLKLNFDAEYSKSFISSCSR